MKRRTALTTIGAGLVPASLPALLGNSGEPSTKKGWAGSKTQFHKTFGATWYYNWTPAWQANQGVEFVPMIKKGADLKKLGAVRKNNKAKFLLGFNEPERKKQGNLSVQQALEHWPAIQKLAAEKNIPLGSPAPSSDRAGLAWLDEFMTQAKKQDLRIDFMALHYYRSRDPDDFEDFIETIAKKYRRPIWITEFNSWAGSEKEHYNFLKKALRYLERSKDVQRYAYFNPPAGKPHSLVDKNGEPTRMGKLYQDA